jgi:hypothetical protein
VTAELYLNTQESTVNVASGVTTMPPAPSTIFWPLLEAFSSVSCSSVNCALGCATNSLQVETACCARVRETCTTSSAPKDTNQQLATGTRAACGQFTYCMKQCSCMHSSVVYLVFPAPSRPPPLLPRTRRDVLSPTTMDCNSTSLLDKFKVTLPPSVQLDTSLEKLASSF